MTEPWEVYSPPVFPLGIILNPILTIDFLQGIATLNRDALIHLGSKRVVIHAKRKSCRIKILPAFGLEDAGTTIDRAGRLKAARDLVQWLRMDSKIKETRSISLVPKPSGLLVAEYTSMVTPRSAKNARTVDDS